MKAKRNEIQKEYTKCSKAVKRSIRKDKRDSKQLYKIIQQLTGNKNRSKDLPLKDKNGQNIYTEYAKLERWREYFEEVMNTNKKTFYCLRKWKHCNYQLTLKPLQEMK